MRKSREQKGITLIALIITIVLMLLLASIAISSIQNDGTLNHAEKEKDKFAQTQSKYNNLMDEYKNMLKNDFYPSGEGTVTENTISGENNTTDDEQEENDEKLRVKEAQQMGVLSTTQNTNVWDEFDNKIVVPAGFKITYDADTVPEGIVIEDGTYTITKGSQFVWIPVGNIKTAMGSKTITLSRYTFDEDGTPHAQGASTINGCEELKTSTYGNGTARDLDAFLESTSNTKSGGYYIGRYEAGKGSPTISGSYEMVCKENYEVFNWTIQSGSSRLCENMYGNGYVSGTFSSDLTNSYAWDTAIVFIQTFGTNTSNYANENRSTSSLTVTGGNGDEYCNINDMSGNASEWTTETCPESMPSVLRGGYYYGTEKEHTTSYRSAYSTAGWEVYNSEFVSFRPILYVAPVS